MLATPRARTSPVQPNYRPKSRRWPPPVQLPPPTTIPQPARRRPASSSPGRRRPPPRPPRHRRDPSAHPHGRRRPRQRRQCKRARREIATPPPTQPCAQRHCHPWYDGPPAATRSPSSRDHPQLVTEGEQKGLGRGKGGKVRGVTGCRGTKHGGAGIQPLNRVIIHHVARCRGAARTTNGYSPPVTPPPGTSPPAQSSAVSVGLLPSLPPPSQPPLLR